MTIDRDMLMEKSEKELPAVALAVNQLTSPQAMRAFLIIALTVTVMILVIMGREIPQELLFTYGGIVLTLFDAPGVADALTQIGRGRK